MCFAKISREEAYYEKIYIINNEIWLPKIEIKSNSTVKNIYLKTVND